MCDREGYSRSSLMSASALADRGLIVHLNGSGWLQMRVTRDTPRSTSDGTYLIVPLVYFTSGSIAFPFTTALLMSKTARAIAQDMNTETLARWRPVIDALVVSTNGQEIFTYQGRFYEGGV